MMDTGHHVYGLDNAQLQARFSKDPSTKVGACILRPDGSLASVGRNGFAKGVRDLTTRLDNREIKYQITVHAEENAIIHAREVLTGFTLYVWPWAPCAHCASVIVNSGIKNVVTIDRVLPPRWEAPMSLAADVLKEGGVRLEFMAEVAYDALSRFKIAAAEPFPT